FVLALLSRDKGWMTAYYDGLAHLKPGPALNYFVAQQRLRTFYEALKRAEPSMEATRGVFRPAPALLVLLTQTQFDANGEPYVPGDLDVWSAILREKASPGGKKALGRNQHLSNPQQLVEALFTQTRSNSGDGPLQIYLALSALDSRRSANERLSPQIIRE